MAHPLLMSNLANYVKDRPSDLIVLATHGRDGIAHWLHGSIADIPSETARVPTLFLPLTASGFVEQRNGEIHLSRVLVPVDHSPPASQAFDTIQNFIGLMNPQPAAIELMHVGETAPSIRRANDGTAMPVVRRAGDVVNTILKTAEEWNADLIAMPTAGPHGFLDAIGGSTTERVARHAPCPVLSVPVS